jgi:hypothetical protein
MRCPVSRRTGLQGHQSTTKMVMRRKSHQWTMTDDSAGAPAEGEMCLQGCRHFHVSGAGQETAAECDFRLHRRRMNKASVEHRDLVFDKYSWPPPFIL